MDDLTPLVEVRAVEPFQKNGYLLVCPEGRQGVYIDPGDEARILLDVIREQQVELVGIVNTHAHLDHISGVGAVKEVWDVPIYLHPEDEELYNHLPTQAQWFGLEYDPAPPVERYLSEDETVAVGRLSIQVLHTPGHSPGHVCLQVKDLVFCGDTVFAGSIGRTDLPGGSSRILLESIHKKILPLGDEKTLFPGHGPKTSVGQERLKNPFLTGQIPF